MTAYPHVASAKIIFEPAIDALGGAAFVVAHVLGKLVARGLLGQGFSLDPSLRSHGRPRILVDDWYVTETAAMLLDLRRIVRRCPLDRRGWSRARRSVLRAGSPLGCHAVKPR